AMEGGKFVTAVQQREQVGAHCHQFAGAPRRAIEAADQFLAPWFGCKMQLTSVAVAWICAPVFDRLRDLFPVRAEVAHQRLEERAPAARVEAVIAIEHLAGYRRA